MNCLSFFPASHDECVGPLVVTRLVATRRLAPRGYRVTAARSLSLTPAVRMVHRVHRDTAVVGTASLPAHAARLANGDVFVIGVADLPDRGHAVLQHLAGLARRQLDQRVIA